MFFVIQMKGVRYFTPNTETHPQFAEALQKTAKEGVKVLAYDCDVTSDAIELSRCGRRRSRQSDLKRICPASCRVVS